MSESAEFREPDQLAGILPPELRSAVVGHAAARAAILEQLGRGKLPGGILIHGPRGIGKATLAFDIARAIFTATSDEDLGHIAAQVGSGAYPNLRVLRKTTRDTGKGYYTVIRVEDVRGFIEELRMTRGRAGHRVAIVDAIDDCNASSANALLKILEEPPADTTFLLVSHRPGGLLPTIRSRCQSIALRPLDDAGVRAVLSGDGAEAHRLDAAVDLAAGRPRRGFEALAMADEGPLMGLRGWLGAPGGRAAVPLALADGFAANKDGAAMAFAREMLLDWLSGEAKAAAQGGAKARLASVSALWDKATALFADAEAFNLDARQTLMSILDGIRKHTESHLSIAEPI